MHTDALIVGAGPAGLSLAISLAHAGFQVTVLEQQTAKALQSPAPDGREIALTHPSVQTLQRLGSWDLLEPHEIGQIREAQIHDGPVGLRPMLAINAEGSGVAQLGRIVPNHALRRTAYEVVSTTPGVKLITEAQVTGVQIHPTHAAVRYTHMDRGVRCEAPELTAPFVVAADSRFSSMRRMLGVGAQMTDFGRTVMVCRMTHTEPHHDVAHECFGYERTLAILPLQPDPDTGERMCSAVITTDSVDAQQLLQLDPEDFAAHVENTFQARLGPMTLVGERHSYPLVATYAHRFSGARWALLGDAAVGMHPVTAHGFNLGLAGVERITAAVAAAKQVGQDWGDAAVLDRYAQGQHRHAFPIFTGTNSIVKLYTDPRPLPRVLRQMVLQGARHLPPLKAAIAAQLTGRSPWKMLRAQLPVPPWVSRD